MDLYQAITVRRSVRVYSPTPIPQDKLDRIWEAVRLAPSACNLQPWRFLALKSPSIKAKARGILQDWALAAPIMVVALGNRNTAWRRDGESIHPIDVAIAMEHLVLAAAAENLGSCWICAFNRNALHTALGLEPDWEPVAATPLGFSDDKPAQMPRKPVDEIVRIL